METWITLWAVFLVTALIAFAVLAIVVSIGGLRDLRTMLARIRSREKH